MARSANRKPTQRPLSSSFLRFTVRILQGNPKKELLRDLCVLSERRRTAKPRRPKPCFEPGLGFRVNPGAILCTRLSCAILLNLLFFVVMASRAFYEAAPRLSDQSWWFRTCLESPALTAGGLLAVGTNDLGV